MGETNVMEVLFPVMVVLFIVAVIAYKLLLGKVEGMRSSMMGVNDCDTSMEDSKESAGMMVQFIQDGMSGDGRIHNECMEAGCDGYFTLAESKDISFLVETAHLAGGRLVVRRVADRDIECASNTALEVKKELTDLDISRAKRIESRYRR